VGRPPNRVLADGLLLVAAAVWGTGFLFQKQAMAVLDPLTFIASRSLVAAIALAPLAVIELRNRSSPPPAGFGSSAVLAATIFVVAAWLQQTGFKTASVTSGGFLTALYVVFTPVVAWLALGKTPPRMIYVAIALSFLGTWLFSGARLEPLAHGDALLVLSAAGWAMHVVTLSRAGQLGRPLAFTCLQFALAALAAAPLAFAFEQPTLDGLRAAAVEIAYVGVLSSALTFTLFTYAMRHTPPAEAAVLASSECLFAAAAGAVVLGERLGLISWVGGGLILAATIIVQFAPRNWSR
jgi:drug/metabolite transporter (DMT)-like permease